MRRGVFTSPENLPPRLNSRETVHISRHKNGLRKGLLKLLVARQWASGHLALGCQPISPFRISRFRWSCPIFTTTQLLAYRESCIVSRASSQLPRAPPCDWPSHGLDLCFFGLPGSKSACREPSYTGYPSCGALHDTCHEQGSIGSIGAMSAPQQLSPGTGGGYKRASRKGAPRRYACPFPSCDRVYSRQEHLQRHQLNRTFC